MFRNREDVVGIVLRFGRGRPASLPCPGARTWSMRGWGAHVVRSYRLDWWVRVRARAHPLLEDYGAGERNEESGSFLS